MIDLKLRPMEATDRGFVLKSWVRSYAKSPDVVYAYAERRDFMEDYTPLVDGMMRRGQVVIAGLPENPDVIAAFLCVEGDTLHWLHVKSRFRECGIAGQLLAGLEGIQLAYSHITPPAERRLRIPDGWKYRPYRRFGT